MAAHLFTIESLFWLAFLLLVTVFIIALIQELEFYKSNSASSPKSLSSSHAPDLLSEETDGMISDAVIMCLDLRGFTKWSKNKHPKDIIIMLNLFFDTVGNAIYSEKGWIVQYVGDSLIAVFGIKDSPKEGSRAAISSVKKIYKRVARLNKRLSKKLPAPLRVGIGLHYGPIVIGQIGHKENASLSIMGKAVKTAIRLEELTTEKKAQIIMSENMLKHLSIKPENFKTEFVVLRDEDIPMEVMCFESVRDLP